MGLFILRRVGVMILTALCLTFIVFFLTNLYPNLEKLAKTQGNQRMSDEAVTSYLGKNGYLQPLPIKYGQWLGVLPGYMFENDDGTVTPSSSPTGHLPTYCCLEIRLRQALNPMFVDPRNVQTALQANMLERQNHKSLLGHGRQC